MKRTPPCGNCGKPLTEKTARIVANSFDGKGDGTYCSAACFVKVWSAAQAEIRPWNSDIELAEPDDRIVRG